MRLGLVVCVAWLALGHAAPASATTTIGPTTYSSNTTWTTSGSPYVITGVVTVTGGAILTVQPGVVVKFNAGTTQLLFNGGKLNASGTSLSPIVFTSIADDTVAGDTGGDGPTTGTAGQWCNLAFGNSTGFVGQTSTLSYVSISYGGKSSCGGAAINLQPGTGTGPIVSLSNTTVRSSSRSASITTHQR